MTPVTYGYARVSKTDDATRNVETQLHILQKFGIREDHVLSDQMSRMGPSDTCVDWTGAAFVRRKEIIPDNSSIRFAKNWQGERCYPQRPVSGR